MSKRVIFIDALNMLYRAYIVDPSLSTNGQPIGGIKGFLKIAQKLIREMKPDAIVIAWDGAGGSRKKRLINKDYKAGRKPIRLNRQIRNLSESEEVENKIWQQTRLTEYLNHLPIVQVMVPSVEADDIIAYGVQLQKYKGWQKIIVSSDKDFIQLCDNETVLYRPIQKVFLNSKRVLEEYGIHPTNFALARALSGDKSDNLPGVPGVGMKTVAKRFPFFADEKVCDINFLLDYCTERQDEKLKVYRSIIENADLVKDNYKLMQLYAPNIHIQGKQMVRSAVEDFEPEFNKTGIMCMMNEDGFGAFDWSSLFTASKRIVRG
jgi:5'-3' exonuclease